jgi:PAS domain S-box-containing protein
MAVAVISLSAASSAELWDLKIPAMWRNPVAGLRLIGYVAGAASAVFLGLSLIRLNRRIAAAARHVASLDGACEGRPAFEGGDALSSAVRAFLERQDDRVRRIRSELRDLRLSAKLSERQRQQTEAIIYSLRDAVVVVDENNRLLMANEPAATLLGFEREQVRHRDLAELCGAEHAEFVDFLRQSAQTQVEGTRREMELRLGDTPHTYDTIASCVHEDDRVSGVVAVLHDITRDKQISQMKNDFVSHVSHELKTPLASITAYSEMLVDGEADDEETRSEFYAIIQTQAQRLNRLIEDILNVSRIESGLIKVHKETVSLTILIEEQLSMIRSYAEEKNITVLGQKPIIYDQVRADKDMMSQVVVNLLSNAVKYTPPGGTVTVGAEVDEIGGLVRVTVADTGVGIPEEEVEHVFDKFYRVGANNKQAKGTGLGLNLVKQIIEKVHHGRVFVTSEVGVGSTFGFELPLATGEPVEAA